MKTYHFIKDQINKIVYSNYFIFIIYLILPWLFFGIGVDVFHIAIAPGDGILYGIPSKIFSSQMQLWNPYIQGGTYTLKQVQSQSLYIPGILIMRLFPNPFGYNLLLLLHYSLAGFFTFLFLRKFNFNRFSTFTGGMIFMFCGFMAAHKGHHAMVMTAAYLPIVLYSIECYFVSQKKLHLFLASLSFAFSIFADYTAVSMYIGMVTLPYIVFRIFFHDQYKIISFARKCYKAITVIIVVFIGGLLIASVQVFPILESLQYITREKINYSFFSSYSFPLKNLPSLLFPLLGEGSVTELTGYMGILPLSFVVLDFILFRKKENQIYFWICVAISGFILVLGNSTPIYKIMYYIPGYNMFRVPARNWLEVNFAVSVLSTIFLHYVTNGENATRSDFWKSVVHLSIFLLGTAFVILYVLKWFIHDPNTYNIWIEKTKLSSSVTFIPLCNIFLALVMLIHFYKFRKSTIYQNIIVILIFFDLFSFGHYHDTGYAKTAFLENKANEIVTFLNQTDPNTDAYRIFTLNFSDNEALLFPEINLLYHLNVINDYGPIWLKDYKQLTGFEANGIVIDKQKLLLNSHTLSMLSTKYLITSDAFDKNLMDSILATNVFTPSNVLIDGFANNKWEYYDSIKKNTEMVILSAGQSNRASLVQIPFEVKSNKYYRVTFSIQEVDTNNLSDPIYVDFFDTVNLNSYANASASIASTMITNEPQKFQINFSSENSPTQQVYLRLYTYSKSHYEITGITLEEMDNIQFVGAAQNQETTYPLYRKVFESSKGIAIYENLNFLPRARFVTNLVPVRDSSQAAQYLQYSYNYDLKSTAFVQGFDEVRELSNGKIISDNYSEDSTVALDVETDGPAFLVLSDTWYPGWRAFINDKETEIYKTNGVSRGIIIPEKGHYQIEFKFLPLSFYLGLSVTICTIVGFLAIAVISKRHIRNKS